MARVPIITPDDWPEEHHHLLESHMIKEDPDGLTTEYAHLRGGRARPSYGSFANAGPDILESFREFQDKLWNVGISKYQRELVIIAIARESEAEYEWHGHVRVALNVGVPPEEIRAISRKEYGIFDPEERTLLEYTIAFCRGAVTDDLFDELNQYFDVETIVGIHLLAGFYFMISRVVEAHGLDPYPPPFVGWELETLEPSE